MTQTEEANNHFLTEARQIPGVLIAKPYGGKTLGEQSIAIVVPALRAPTSRQVFELEGETLRSFPESRLEVRVIGLKECGVASSQIASAMKPDYSDFAIG